MQEKQLFKIDTILSEDVLDEDSLSLITGGTGSSSSWCIVNTVNCMPNCKGFTCSNYKHTCNYAQRN